MPDELATETDPCGVMFDEVGDTERCSSRQSLEPTMGGGAAGLPLRIEGMEKREAVLLARLPMEGRCSFSGSSAVDCRIVLAWTRQPRLSISSWAGLQVISQSWMAWSIGGGGNGNPSSAQKVCSTV